MTLSYTLLDVFTSVKFGGNPLAVFKNGEGLSGEQMQLLASELNLSETTFILPPRLEGCKYRLRIFTPKAELPFAGHPTIGSVYVLVTEGFIPVEEGDNRFLLEEEIGPIPITVTIEEGKVAGVLMEQPLPKFGPIYDQVERVAELLSLQLEDLVEGAPVQTVSSGVPFLYVPIRSLEAMKRISFREDVWKRDFAGEEAFRQIFVFTGETETVGSTVHSRMFAPGLGIPEDPATGGASGPLGAYLHKYGWVSSSGQENVIQLRSEQGLELGRPSFIDIRLTQEPGGQELKKVEVGGSSVRMGSGEIDL